MCDYSLMHLPNRLAREGESLVVYRFPSGSKGCASPGDLEAKVHPEAKRKRSFWAVLNEYFRPAHNVPAVCIPPGAKLQLNNVDPDFQREYKIQSEEEVTFEQVSEAAYTYRDAICFPSGLRVLLQELREGQRITVLTLVRQRQCDSVSPAKLESELLRA